jgi:hypothetical protein
MAKPILVLVAFLAVSCGPLSGVRGTTPPPADLFSFTSDPSDAVGSGESKSFTPPTSKFVAEPGTTRDYLQLVVEGGGDYWSIDIAAPTGHALEVGTYDNAVEPSARTGTTPGLMVYGEGRACNRSTGNFTIKQIAFDQQGRLVALQATFVQRCAVAGAGALRGTLAFGRPATTG